MMFKLSAAAVCAALLLGGCSGESVAPGPVQNPHTASMTSAASHALGGASRPNNPSSKLLYIVDPEAAGGVYVFEYPSLTPVGTLTGFTFNDPEGLCINGQNGDIYVVNTATEPDASSIVGYHHGALTPFVILNSPGSFSLGCAVDPVTGDVAVSNPGGTLAIYTDSVNPPHYITSPYFQYLAYVGYDPQGNLWLDGQNSSGAFQYGEISNQNPVGSIVPKVITPSIGGLSAGNVQWDGHHMTVGDNNGGIIYQLRPNGTEFGSTVLSPTQGELNEYFIKGHHVIVPGGPSAIVEVYSYPGGALQKTISPLGCCPMGAGISL